MYHVLLQQACALLWKTLRRHSMSAVAAQLPCPPLILPSGVILPPCLPSGARIRGGLRSFDGDCIPLISAPFQTILRHRGDQGTLASQMEPEDAYSRFRSAIPGILLSMSAALESRSSDGERSPFHNAGLQICSWTRWIAVISNYRWRLIRSRKILKELLNCSSCVSPEVQSRWLFCFLTTTRRTCRYVSGSNQS